MAKRGPEAAAAAVRARWICMVKVAEKLGLVEKVLPCSVQKEKEERKGDGREEAGDIYFCITFRSKG